MTGLKGMRKVQTVGGEVIKHKKPIYKCENCGCIRYNPCTCAKKNVK